MELKLWFREGIEYFNFSKLQAPWSQSLRTRRRRRKRIKRRTCENTNHNVTAPFEEGSIRALQSLERSMRAPPVRVDVHESPRVLWEVHESLPVQGEVQVGPLIRGEVMKASQSGERPMRATQSDESSVKPPNPRGGP